MLEPNALQYLLCGGVEILLQSASSLLMSTSIARREHNYSNWIRPQIHSVP